MATLTQPPVLYYICSKRCGEVRMTPNCQQFQLICDFCTKVFEDFLEFQLHMRKKHCAYEDTTINSNSNNIGKQSNMNISELAQRVDLGTSLSVRDIFTETYQEQRTQKETLNHQPDEVVTETLEHKVIVAEANNDIEGAQSLTNTAMDPLAIAAPTLIKVEPNSDDDESNNISCDITEKETSKPKQAKNFGREIRLSFLRNKQKLYTFIEIIKRKPVLWNTEYSYDDRVKALKKVAIVMNKKFNCLEFNEMNVERRIKSVYAIWTKMKAGKMQKAWFYQYLKFFNARNLKNPETNLRLNNHYNYLIDEYKMHEVLWNFKHPQYINKYEEDIAYNEITKKMCQKFPQRSYNKNIIIHKIKHLKCAYTKMCAGEIPKMWYFEKLEFLNIATKEELAILENINWQEMQNQVFNAVDELLKYTPDTVYEKVNSLLDDFADNGSMSDYSDFEGFSEDVSFNRSNLNDSTGSNNMCEENDKTDLNGSKNVKSKEISLALIALFKKNTSLWDKDDVNYFQSTSRLEHYTNMAKILNSRFNLNLTLSDVRRRIKQILGQSNYSKYLTFLRNYKATPKLLYQESAIVEKAVEHNCPTCDKPFPTVSQLKIHQIMHMSQHELPYLCELCGENFRCPQTFRAHKSKMHNEPWPFMCEICKAGFGSRTQLILHTRMHTGEKPYLCQECGKSYRTLKNIHEHRDRHANNPRYKCTTCGKRFYTRAKLKHHMKIHTNTRDHICDICGKDFILRSNLRTHKQIHSNDFKYKCRFCSQSFKQRSGCYNHMKNQHQIAS